MQYTKGRIARGIGILYKTRKYLKESSMKTLYYAFIYPYFTYCITVWGNTVNSVLEPLIALQKRAKRIVCGAQKFDHTYPLFQLSKILPLRNLYRYSAQLFLYKYYRHSHPNIFSGFFTINETIHNHYTGQIEHFYIHLAKSSQRARKNIKMHWCKGNQLLHESFKLQLRWWSIQTKTQRTYFNEWFFTLVWWYTIIIYT